ncbi:hypothetical protein F6S87_07260 [Bifidobacterium sp. BRDM6]|uniref:Uncharacterized protein n=1 Tax=Bifidobacterium choloepi TaxID=2614131 RepID=A0A6I5NJ34_9BIFI|nr:hypothetical protein [Bifidobacterium choloepi]
MNNTEEGNNQPFFHRFSAGRSGADRAKTSAPLPFLPQFFAVKPARGFGRFYPCNFPFRGRNCPLLFPQIHPDSPNFYLSGEITEDSREKATHHHAKAPWKGAVAEGD